MCDEAERRLQYLINKSKELKVDCTRPMNLKIQNDAIMEQARNRQTSMEMLFDALDKDIIDKEKFVQEQAKIIADMQQNINKQVDYCHVLTFVAQQSNELRGMQMETISDMQQQPLLENAGVNISFVSGTIKAGDEPLRMQRMLFRITRGKALTHFSEKFVQDKVDKVCYLVVF